MKDKTFMGEVAALRDRNLAYDQQIDQTADIAVRHMTEYTGKLAEIFNGCDRGELPIALLAFERMTTEIRKLAEKHDAVMAGYILCKNIVGYSVETVSMPTEDSFEKMMGRDGK